MTPKPERPSWAVYGPWWDQKSGSWHVIGEDDWVRKHYPSRTTGGDWALTGNEATLRELLRVAQENEGLRTLLSQITVAARATAFWVEAESNHITRYDMEAAHALRTKARELTEVADLAKEQTP